MRKGLPVRNRLNSAIQGEVIVEGTHSHDRHEKYIKILIEKKLERKKGLGRPAYRWTDNMNRQKIKYVL